jgi:orotate phosphoribosyltransferase
MNQQQVIAKLLLDKEAVFLRPQDPFTWTSGIKSPVYCDNRLLISSVDARKTIISAFTKILKTMDVNVIAGTATAGIPWAAWIAQEMELPLVYVRSSEKAHGRQNAIEGKAPENGKTVLIEDLVSTGKSSVAAALRLKEAGVEVVKVLSIFTYGFDSATKAFRDSGFSYEALTSFEVLAQVAYDEKKLDRESLNEVLEWRKRTGST